MKLQASLCGCRRGSKLLAALLRLNALRLPIVTVNFLFIIIRYRMIDIHQDISMRSSFSFISLSLSVDYHRHWVDVIAMTLSYYTPDWPSRLSRCVAIKMKSCIIFTQHFDVVPLPPRFPSLCLRFVAVSRLLLDSFAINWHKKYCHSLGSNA